jgi:hypothetical protein
MSMTNAEDSMKPAKPSEGRGESPPSAGSGAATKSDAVVLPSPPPARSRSTAKGSELDPDLAG